jgi:hypothetical protein
VSAGRDCAPRSALVTTGLEQSLWTHGQLAHYLATQRQITLSIAGRVRVLLHQHGIHLKQPTPVVHSRDRTHNTTQKGEGGGDLGDRRTYDRYWMWCVCQAELALNPGRLHLVNTASFWRQTRFFGPDSGVLSGLRRQFSLLREVVTVLNRQYGPVLAASS